jgi:large subunit ribosomal protein L7/L12
VRATQHKQEDLVVAPKAPEKVEFSLYLKAIDSSLKTKVIKEIKQIIPNLNLVEAKAFVESTPRLVKDKLKKEEAETIKKNLESVGATVSLE